jgi:hypothetical protein
MGRFRKSSISRDEFYKDQHRFEHWLRNNTIYFNHRALSRQDTRICVG